MTKLEIIRPNEEKKAQLAAGPEMGGIALPVSRNNLLKAFWILAVFLGGSILAGRRSGLAGEGIFVGGVLYVLCLTPAWLWASGRVSGLPVFPVFALSFIPTYVSPFWKGTIKLSGYTLLEINTAAWTLAGFLAISILIWQQLCVSNKHTPENILMIEQIRSEWILMLCLLVQVVFEVGIYFFKEMGEGIFPVIRSFAGSAGRLGLFIFSYQVGKGKLPPLYKGIFIIAASVILVRQMSSLLLSTAIPTIGIIFAGYILGKGKIPWAVLITTLTLFGILQMGKTEMREEYFIGKKRFSLENSLEFFEEWIGYGLKNAGFTKSAESKRDDIESVQERGSLIQVMLKIQKETPSRLPYLEGETYRYIPEMLIPRIMNKEKVWAHTGNMILSVYYGLLEREKIFMTSIAFDPIIEAYANFGYAGVFFLAAIMGMGIAFVTNLTTRVPMLSFRFLVGVQLLAVLISSFNTAGVLITSLWQSLISLGLLSFTLMRKTKNPLFLESIPQGVIQKPSNISPSIIQTVENPQMALRECNIDQQARLHERPKRFVYRKNK